MATLWAGSARVVEAMHERIEIEPVDRVGITTLYENLVDATIPGGGLIGRLRSTEGAKIVSRLLEGERRDTFVRTRIRSTRSLRPSGRRGYRCVKGLRREPLPS